MVRSPWAETSLRVARTLGRKVADVRCGGDKADHRSSTRRNTNILGSLAFKMDMRGWQRTVYRASHLPPVKNVLRFFWLISDT